MLVQDGAWVLKDSMDYVTDILLVVNCHFDVVSKPFPAVVGMVTLLGRK